MVEEHSPLLASITIKNTFIHVACRSAPTKGRGRSAPPEIFRGEGEAGATDSMTDTTSGGAAAEGEPRRRNRKSKRRRDRAKARAAADTGGLRWADEETMLL